MNFLKKNGILAVVFLTGAAVLVVEVLAFRILSPYYGNTIFSTSSVLSVILLALSLGYYIGGKLIDRNPSLKLFFGIILAGGISVIFINFFIAFFLPQAGLKMSIMYGPLVSSLVMFFIPGFLLGMLSPFAIKLQQKLNDQEGIGTIAGKIFFWSTCGSIIGSLLTGFVLIPNFGVDKIITAVGVFLIGLGLVPLLFLGADKKTKINYLWLILAVFFIEFFVFLNKGQSQAIYQTEGLYQKISIFDADINDQPARALFLDKTFSSAMYLNSDELVLDYSRYYPVYKAFKPEAKDFLIIGAAAFSLPKAIIKDMPQAQVDVVDIEPGFYDLSKRYFNLKDNNRLKNYVEDGRRFLVDSDKQYDFIFGDAFYSFDSIPTHLTTVEFFNIVKNKLTPDGIFVCNFIGTLDEAKGVLFYSQIKTFRQAFSKTYVIAVKSDSPDELQNFIVIGHNSEQNIDFKDPAVIAKLDTYLQSIKDKLIDPDSLNLSEHLLLTDNYAPVDYLASKFIR